MTTSARVLGEPTVETYVCRNGVVTFTATPTEFVIEGVRNPVRPGGPSPRYRYAVARCDCRENADSEFRRGGRSHQYTAVSNIGTRELCLQQPFHVAGCHNRRDHCEHRGHEIKVRAVLDAVVRSYNHAPRTSTSHLISAMAGNRRITAGRDERSTYRAWLAANDPSATDPYA